MSTGVGNEPLLIELSAAFRKDAKRMRKRGKVLAVLQAVAESIMAGVALEDRHRDHALLGDLGAPASVMLSRIGC